MGTIESREMQIISNEICYSTLKYAENLHSLCSCAQILYFHSPIGCKDQYQYLSTFPHIVMEQTRIPHPRTLINLLSLKSHPSLMSINAVGRNSELFSGDTYASHLPLKESRCFTHVTISSL